VAWAQKVFVPKVVVYLVMDLLGKSGAHAVNEEAVPCL
jgi:hypothetical protein